MSEQSHSGGRKANKRKKNSRTIEKIWSKNREVINRASLFFYFTGNCSPVK